MARNYMYVYERIYKEQNAMQAEFRKIPIKGKRTSAADVKRVRSIISDSNYQVAQECQVIVSYPQMHIEGTEVVLGEPLIMLPDCRLINMEQLKDIELGRKNKEDFRDEFSETEVFKRRGAAGKGIYIHQQRQG